MLMNMPQSPSQFSRRTLLEIAPTVAALIATEAGIVTNASAQGRGQDGPRRITKEQLKDSLEILGLVLVVGNLSPVTIKPVLARPPTDRVPLGDVERPQRRVRPAAPRRRLGGAVELVFLVDRDADATPSRPEPSSKTLAPTSSTPLTRPGPPLR